MSLTSRDLGSLLWKGCLMTISWKQNEKHFSLIKIAWQGRPFSWVKNSERVTWSMIIRKGLGKPCRGYLTGTTSSLTSTSPSTSLSLGKGCGLWGDNPAHKSSCEGSSLHLDRDMARVHSPASTSDEEYHSHLQTWTNTLLESEGIEDRLTHTWSRTCTKFQWLAGSVQCPIILGLYNALHNYWLGIFCCLNLPL